MVCVVCEFTPVLVHFCACNSFPCPCCERHDVSYVMLVDEPGTGLVVMQGRGRPKKVIGKEGVGYVDMVQLREDLMLGDDQKVLLALGWGTDEEILSAAKHPEFWCGDVTSGSNREKRELFVFAGKRADGSGFVGCRIFLPSQKRWVFNWIWEHCVPHLLGDETVRGVRLVLTDGDADEYIPLRLLIEDSGSLWQNAHHGLCKWHLLWQSWKKNVMPLLPDTDEGTKYGENNVL